MVLLDPEVDVLLLTVSAATELALWPMLSFTKTLMLNVPTTLGVQDSVDWSADAQPAGSPVYV